MGLKNFLSDYSLIDEKMHIEVHTWENYLIFANLLGIADKVKQQFRKIYPNFNSVDTIFEIPLDNTLIVNLNSAYRFFKVQFLDLIIAVLYVFLIICAMLEER